MALGPMVANADWEKHFTIQEMKAIHGQKTVFLFVQRRRKMVHTVPTKGFRQLSPEAAICYSTICVQCWNPPTSSLLVRNLIISHKDITRVWHHKLKVA